MDNSTAISSRESRIAVPDRTASLAVVANTVSHCVAWIRNQVRIRRDVDTLMAFDDHLLADIGLNRDQVQYAARSGHLPGRCDGVRIR